jgi:aspartate/methionine/tyrosine aminotransferase
MNYPPRSFSSDYMHWAKTRQAARFNLGNSGLFNYPLANLPIRLEDLELSGPSFYGYEPLQAALSHHLGVPKERIVHSTGTSLANHLAMAVCFEPGDDVLIEEPTYELLISTASYLGANVIRFKRPAAAGFRLDLEEIRRKLTPRTKLIVLTNLHNPSSAYADEATLTALAALAGTVGARVLVDEVYLDAAFELAPKTAQVLADNIVTTSSLTKVYGLSGIRCGWIIANPELAEKIWRLNDLFGVIPAHAAERLSVYILNHFGPVAAHARGLLTTNREMLNQFLGSRADLEVEPLRFGTVAFPRLRSGQVDQLCEILRARYETSVVPGHFFEMPDHFRVGIGRSTADLAEGLDRLGKALDELSKAV